MKAIKLIPCLIALMICASGCHLSNKNAGQPSSNDSLSQTSSADTTVYGICGDGTSMHSLELVTDEGNTFTYLIDEEDATPVVKGGLLAGDRMAVVGNHRYQSHYPHGKMDESGQELRAKRGWIGGIPCPS